MSWFSDTWNWATKKVSDAVDSVKSIADLAAKSFYGRLVTLTKNMVNFTIKHGVKIVPDLITAIVEIYQSEFLKEGVQIITSVMTRISDIFKDIAAGSKDLFKYAKKLLDLTVDVKKLMDLVGKKGDKFFLLIKEKMEKLGGNFKKAWDDFVKIIKDAGGSDIDLKKVVANAVESNQKAAQTITTNFDPASSQRLASTPAPVRQIPVREVNLNFNNPMAGVMARSSSDYTNLVAQANKTIAAMGTKH